jgi:hypothetical protein
VASLVVSGPEPRYYTEAYCITPTIPWGKEPGEMSEGNSGDGLGVEQWGCRKARDGMHSPIELLRRMEGQRGLYRVRILVEDTAGEGITGR